MALCIKLVMLRKNVLISIFTCLTFSTTIMVALLHMNSDLWFLSPDQTPCLEEHKVYINGQIVRETRRGVKYLSYQPPGGGWNNQRIVFENAVILAKLLNRTLIVHPLAPHPELMRIQVGDYENYNLLSKDKLLPLSNVMDLKQLSKLVPVKEYESSHIKFQHSYKHLTWARVCHNGMVGTWVDTIPRETDEEKWRLLRRRMNKSLPAYKDIPFYRRICKTEFKKFEVDGVRPVWGIMDELPQIHEDLMYFSEGSLRNQMLLFFDKKAVLDAHEWIMRFVDFAPGIWKRSKAVLKKMEHPFNAIHVRRTDYTSILHVKQDYWLKKLKANNALRLTRNLYIATDEGNKTWFQPFRDAGYNVFFAEDFKDQFCVKNIKSDFIQDLVGLCEQLICAHAEIFVGSHYSSFSTFIQRLRTQFTWKKGMLLRKPYTTIIWMQHS